jgi:hypothetical protein
MSRVSVITKFSKQSSIGKKFSEPSVCNNEGSYADCLEHQSFTKRVSLIKISWTEYLLQDIIRFDIIQNKRCNAFYYFRMFRYDPQVKI